MEPENIAGFSYYAGHNRLSAALLFLSFVWAQTPLRARFGESCVAAAILFLLLATKISGFVVGLGIFSLAALSSPVKRTILSRALALLMAAVIALQLSTGMPLAYVNDIRAMLAINRAGISYFLGSTALKGLPALLAGLALCWALVDRSVFAARPVGARILPVLRSHRAALMIAAVFAGTLAAESQNTGSLLFAAALAVVVWPMPVRHTSPALVKACKVGVAVAILTPWWGSIAQRGFLVAARDARQLVAEPALGLLIPATTSTAAYSQIADDLVSLWDSPAPPSALLSAAAELEPANALALARTIQAAAADAARHGFVKPETRVMTVAGIDFFARILGARSAPGINLWQDLERTFRARPVDEMRAYLRSVDAAFMRRCEVEPIYTKLNELFVPALRQDFTPREVAGCWTVWIRRS